MDDRLIDVRDEAGRGVLLTDSSDISGSDAMASTEDTARRIVDLEAENAELRLQLAVLASTDAATGLANRVGLLDSIEMATYRLARMQEPFAVVLMTFPQLEAIGDEDDYLEAIRDVGALLAAGVRSVDKVGRETGSTFVSVLANIPEDHVEIVLQRTRASLFAVSAAASLPGASIDPHVVAVSLATTATELTASEILDRCHQFVDDGGSEIRSI